MDQMYMKEKPILPLLLSMALPMVISMFVNSLYNIIDSIFRCQDQRRCNDRIIPCISSTKI